MTGDALPPDLAAAVRLGGEMGRRFAEFDWAAHPLGPPQDWPVELRTAVAVALTTRFPIVLWLGADDLFLVYNDAYIPALGDKHPAALGRPGADVWWEIWDPIGPMLASVVDTGAATWSADLLLTILNEGRLEERYFTFSYSPLIGDHGAVEGIFCAVTETTQRVLSERRLQVLNAAAAAAMDAHTTTDAVAAAINAYASQPAELPFVAVYIDDPAANGMTLCAATPATMPALPHTLAQLTNRAAAPPPRTAVQVIEDLTAVIPGMEAVLGDYAPRQAIVLGLGEPSTRGALVIGTNPRRPLDEQYRGFCQLLADQLSSALSSALSHEQQRQRADALAELDRAKTAFLANVSHEFRTPLTLLLGPLDDALAESGEDSALADRLGTARRNAGRLLRLVDSLLDFSRIQAGRATAELQCMDVGAMTARIASSFAELCDRVGLELRLHCDPVLADIDPAMWETIVLNLLSNAVKYTLEGSVSVDVSAEADGCRVRVSDTGIGIASEHLDRLFDRFYRAANGAGRSVEGSGIGLSLVHGLVELHHGTVEIDSDLGAGTAVTIRLPRPVDVGAVRAAPVGRLDPSNPYVAEASQWVPPPPRTEPVPGTASDRCRPLVLIADDNADMRNHLDRVLSEHWDTLLVADGRSALQAARELHPDVVVTDVMMPGLDGLELTSAMRAEPALASIPIIMLSARAGPESVSEGFAGGADDYLPKPFGSRELVDRVAARLSAADREKDGRRQREEEIRRQSALLKLDNAMQAADSVGAILEAVLGSPLCSLGAGAAAIGVVEPQERHLRVEFAGTICTETRDRYHVASVDAPGPMARAVATGEPLVVADTVRLDGPDRRVVDDFTDSAQAYVTYPLHDGAGRVVGALLLSWPAPRAFGPAELDMLASTAGIAQSALDRIRVLRRDHRIAVEFQEQLLDLSHGSTSAVVAAAYQPAGEAMRVGGDWYLVAPLDQDGRIGISVGDVVGHGLPAAIAMSRLRAAIAATALTGAEPAAVLDVLDTYAATVPGARCATVTYAVVDTVAARLSYLCAGHPYPLLAVPDRPPVLLMAGRRAAMAAHGDKAPEHTAHAALPPGSLILLYTDGLIERPGESLDHGFARLQRAAADCAGLPVGAVCAELVRRLAPPGGYTDDVVVLALRPAHATPRSFATVVPAVLNQIPVARRRLRAWLCGIGADPRREHDILLAVGEAVTNAIEHGSTGAARQTVSIEAFLSGGTVAATVGDSGSWSRDSAASHRNASRGRGLTLMNGLANRVDTVRTASGTRITLQFYDFAHAVPAVNGSPR